MAENWYNLIEDYNLGNLPDSRRAQFEAAMADDPALARAVQEHRIEWEARELLAEQILRTQIREAFEEHSGNSGSWFSKYWKWILAAVLILITAVVLILKNRQPVAPKQEPLPTAPPKIDSLPPKVPIAQVPPGSKPGTAPQPNIPAPSNAPDYKALALAAYRTPDGLTSVRGAADGDTLSLVQKAFIQKDYALVLRYLAILPTDAQQEGLSLRAHANYLLGNYTAARRDFSDLLAGGVYLREAQWFGLLADMAAGVDKKNWKKRLDAIRLDANHPWQKDAAALWREMGTGR